MQIILASGSSIRRQMLQDAGVNFTVVKPLCDEDSLKNELAHLPTQQLAIELAKAKAASVSVVYPDALVIGSDQICLCDGVIINKSTDEISAFDSLRFLSGKTHQQINGTCVYQNNTLISQHNAIAEICVKNLSDSEILEYIKADNPIGCAGSYKFESKGKNLFSKITGETETILGFGLNSVLKVINEINCA